jgi:hypothetical protein
MRLYYISFFYFNIILLLFFIFKIDLIFLLLLSFRKTYSIFKESLTEYIFQEFDGLIKESQMLDLYENKLYVDFGLDAGLEEFYIQNLYMQYALYDISLDFESYSGNFTFKWNDNNVEELNIKKNRETNFKKIYIDLFYTKNYFYNNLKEKSISRAIDDDDYLNLYNYKGMNRREIEEPLFVEENEKYYYNYLKIFFLKENFYDIFIKNYYIRNLDYNNFINKLKNKVFINKYKKKNERFFFIKDSLFFDFNDNLLQIKKELLDSSYLKK